VMSGGLRYVHGDSSNRIVPPVRTSHPSESSPQWCAAQPAVEPAGAPCRGSTP
jgi:hypothetical protein